MPRSRGGDRDGGVGARMEGTFLTQMNDMKESVFWCFTANDVDSMHEAFFRAERVDAVFYVKLPTPEQRARVWKLYLEKFFPPTINGNAYAGHIPLDVDTLIKAFKTQKKPNLADWTNRFVAAVLCLSGDERIEAKGKISELAEIRKEFSESLFNDEGWTPAEIRACCRLSRRLKEPLAKTKRRIRPVSTSAAKSFARLDRWASESALDAETGEVYVSEKVSTTTHEGTSTRGETAKVKRRVRPLNN